MTGAGLVRRIGTNLNQAVARLNATGQRGEDLMTMWRQAPSMMPVAIGQPLASACA